MPLMVMSSKCHLRGLSPEELVARKEDHFEIGGYFIASGNEKVIRLLNMNRTRFDNLFTLFLEINRIADRL